VEESLADGWRNIRIKAGGIMLSDVSYVGQNAAVMEYQYGSHMCKTIQLAGINMLNNK
jgi:hypothetical protein